MKTLRLFALTVILLYNLPALAQEDIDRYFEDDSFSGSSKLIKVGYDALYNEKLVSFEHRLFVHASLEHTIGFSDVDRLHKLFPNFPVQTLPESGNLITIMTFLRLYKMGYFERLYAGVMPRITIIDGRMYGDIAFVAFGYQRPIKGRLLFDISSGIGIRFADMESPQGNPVFGDDVRSYFPMQFKLCYVF